LSRRAVTVALEPLAAGQGLRLCRADTGEEWPLNLEHVVSATNCTAIGSPESHVAYLEHLLAALHVAAISDVRIVTDAPELPLYDGSAQAWWEAIQTAGRAPLEGRWDPLVIAEPMYWQQGEQVLLGVPAASARYAYLLDYPEPLIGRQSACWDAGEDFGEELARARTFATAQQVMALLGLAEVPPQVEAACTVIYPDRVSPPPEWPNAFARHKLVDLLGDLYLAGRPVVGQVLALKTGHAANHAFLGELLRLADQAS
jgi:UDP-3-O-[3-hydroxymyristoyl] N-acetylglucosamine deacetylase